MMTHFENRYAETIDLFAVESAETLNDETFSRFEFEFGRSYNTSWKIDLLCSISKI